MRNPTSDIIIRRSHVSKVLFPSHVVALPARNERAMIAACLGAVDAQNASVGVVCLVNNSDDGTFEAAVAQADALSIPMRIFDVVLPPDASHAGGARRVAMDLAAAWLGEGPRKRRSILLTTDADSVAAPDWVRNVDRALGGGADAVAGRIELDRADAARLPDHLHARGRLESTYEALLTEMFSRFDPRPHDPWPRHSIDSGANLAVTLTAYRAIGGLPLQPCGEDKALVASLDNFGFRVRHDPAVRVTTSGRLEGRATGGVADTIRQRCVYPDSVCDAYLEPAMNARFRGYWRGRLRGLFEREGGAAALRAFSATSLPTSGNVSFGAFWEALEASDPRLSREPLRPAALPDEIAAARTILRRLARAQAISHTGPADSPLFVPAE